jgi:hypothetical protein
MPEPVSVAMINGVIRVIQGCLAKYYDFYAFKEECTAFQSSLRHVVETLEGILSRIGAGNGSGNTTLRRPLDLLWVATENGRTVLATCSSQKKLQAILYSRHLIGGAR